MFCILFHYHFWSVSPAFTCTRHFEQSLTKYSTYGAPALQVTRLGHRLEEKSVVDDMAEGQLVYPFVFTDQATNIT